MLSSLRKFLWRLLGVGHEHMIRVVDQPYLKNDKYTTKGIGTYDNNALVYRWSDAPLKIGRYCSISYGVKFIMDDGKHTSNQITNYPFSKNQIMHAEGITIGNDVWIGMNALIMYGVTIGDGASIAAGSIVTNDVPSYTVVGGVPAKLIKEKCSRDEAAMMQDIAWWNWDKNIIDSRIDDFKMSYKDFISKYK